MLAIETHNLRKEYGLKVAVEELTLQVPQGEVFGFLGPNGAGKSTTVKMLLGLVKPTSGTVNLLGKPAGNPHTRAKVGFLPEHFRFHEWLNATEFLNFHGKLYGLSNRMLKNRVPELLDLVGLSKSATQKLAGFSKGMLQRIGLAQAMLNSPQVIFLDEPTSGLDPLGRRLVRDIIYKLKTEGTTVFLNSHLLSEVEVTCDRVAFIKQGRVVQTDLMSNLTNQSMEVKIEVDELEPELIQMLAEIGHSLKPNGNKLSMVVDNKEKIGTIAEIIIKRGYRLYELSPKPKSLEEIFVSIIENEGGN